MQDTKFLKKIQILIYLFCIIATPGTLKRFWFLSFCRYDGYIGELPGSFCVLEEESVQETR